MSDEDDKKFIGVIRQYIDYWDRQNDRSSKEKMEGLSFSILCMLDGISGSFDGDIHCLCNQNHMLHEMFYKKEI